MKERIKGYEKEGQLLAQRNQQIRSLERDLASKEEVIHKILAEKEQAMILANKVSLYWKCRGNTPQKLLQEGIIGLQLVAIYLSLQSGGLDNWGY